MSKTIIQKVMTAPNEIIFQEASIPESANNQVLLKIRRIGICGKDIHIHYGLPPLQNTP